MKKVILLCFLLLIGSGLSAHPIKMTTSRLSLDKRTGQLTLLLNFFIDDFGAHLQKIYHQRSLKLESAGDQEKSMINAYITRKLLMKVNRQTVSLRLSGIKKLEENVLQVAFTIPVAGTIKQVELTNTLLFDAFPDEQVNIVHLDLPGKLESTVLQFSPSDSYKAINLN